VAAAASFQREFCDIKEEIVVISDTLREEYGDGVL
jgi:hypothetical protein